MYGPASGQVISIDPASKSYRMPVPFDAKAFKMVPDDGPPELAEPIKTVEYGPRPMSGNIWYPLDPRNWYVGPQWDGFRPDGAPSPADSR